MRRWYVLRVYTLEEKIWKIKFSRRGDDPIDAINHMMSFLTLVVTSRRRDEQWFKDKVLLVQAQENGQVLQEEELEFLADPGTSETSST
nr:hypothetical protein [Tanacetum cinerariifolium]